MPKGDGVFKWWWAVGTSEPEIYHGPCDTREEAIDTARGDYGAELGFVIVEADRSVPTCNIFDSDRVLEDYEEHNEECWGEDGADLGPSGEQQRDLENMLRDTLDAWFKKHSISQRGWAFSDQRNQETFEPEPATKTA